MESKSTKALNMELMALAPECEGPKAQELENLIYRLPGVRKVEYEATEAEYKRLSMVLEEANAGRYVPESDTADEAVVKAREESDTVVTELVTLAVVWEGTKGMELSKVVKQLPRAVKAERTPAGAEMDRLKAELSAFKAHHERGQALLKSPQTGSEESARRLAAVPTPPPMFGENTTRFSANQLGVRPETQAERPMKPPPSGPAAMRQTGSVSTFAGPAMYMTGSPQQIDAFNMPYPSPLVHGHRAQTHLEERPRKRQRSDSESSIASPHAGEPTSSRRRKDSGRGAHKIERGPRARPACGDCNFKNLPCNSKARCQHCSPDRRCIYMVCSNGSACKGRKCNRLHPGQWEIGDSDGKAYLIKGVNVRD